MTKPTSGEGEASELPPSALSATTLDATQSERENGSGDPIEALLGQVLAERYRVQSFLGSGGMGVVYGALHTAIQREVAIKVLLPRHAPDPVCKSRFLNEAKAAARIVHDHVVDLFDFGETAQGLPFFVMERLRGENLAARLKRGGPLPWTHAQRMFSQILQAVAAAHALGIIHRDLKPSNVFLVQGKAEPIYCKLIDFGIAKALDSEEPEQNLTRTGAVFGTAAYMAPEQAQGKRLDQRTDIYALGAILYETVCGVPPLQGESFLETISKQIYETPVSPRERSDRFDLPPAVDSAIMRALSKSPDERFQSVEQFADTLDPAVGYVGHRPPRKPTVLRWVRGFALILVLTLLVGLLWFLGGGFDRPDPGPTTQAQQLSPAQTTPLPQKSQEAAAVSVESPGASPAKPTLAEPRSAEKPATRAKAKAVGHEAHRRIGSGKRAARPQKRRRKVSSGRRSSRVKTAVEAVEVKTKLEAGRAPDPADDLLDPYRE